MAVARTKVAFAGRSSVAGWVCIGLAIGVLGIVVLIGLVPISVEGGSCGSTLLQAKDTAYDCRQYFDAVKWLIAGCVVVAVALGVAGVLALRRTHRAG